MLSSENNFWIIFFTAMMLTSDYIWMLVICSALGVAKGIRSVYMSIVIPSYIPIDRLASASAIQLFGNGIVMMCVGPALGWFQYDDFKSYRFDSKCHFMKTKIVSHSRINQRRLRKLCRMHTIFKSLHNRHNINVLHRIDLYLV